MGVSFKNRWRERRVERKNRKTLNSSFLFFMMKFLASETPEPFVAFFKECGESYV